LRAEERRCKQPRLQSSLRLRRSSRVLTRLPLAPAATEAACQSTSPGLPLPSAHTSEEGPRFAGGATARFVPPSGFGYPLGGLLPSTPGRVCFIPTALLGFPPAEPFPPGRWDRVSPIAAPACRQIATRSDAANHTGRHRDHRLPGFGPPPESHDLRRVFSPLQAGCSRGVQPFQGCPASRLARGSHPALPLRASPKNCRRQLLGRHLRVSISGRLARLMPH
jgi:hypothetical protein